MTKSYADWVTQDYFRGVYTLINSNRTYLNQGITWSIGVVSAFYLAGLGFLRSTSTPDHGEGIFKTLQTLPQNDVFILTIAISVAIAIVSHFLSRSIKGYLNIIRYVSLYSECLEFAQHPKETGAEAKLQEYIATYDKNFVAPLNFRSCLWKMFTELGFLLFFAVMLVPHCLLSFALLRSEFCFLVSLAAALPGPIWFFVELALLRKSTYFKTVKVWERSE